MAANEQPRRSADHDLVSKVFTITASLDVLMKSISDWPATLAPRPTDGEEASLDSDNQGCSQGRGSVALDRMPGAVHAGPGQSHHPPAGPASGRRAGLPAQPRSAGL